MRQGSGCGGFRAGISGVSRILRWAVWPPGDPGAQRSLSANPAGAGVSGSQTGASWGGMGAGLQRLSQAGEEIGGGPGSTAVGWASGPTARPDVPGLSEPAGTGPGVVSLSNQPLPAGELDLGGGPLCGGWDSGGKESTGRRRNRPWRCWSGQWRWAIGGPAVLPRTTPSTCRRPSATGWQPWECTMSWTFQRGLRCGLWSLSGPAPIPGPGAPRKPRLRAGQRQSMEQRAAAIPERLGGR